MRVELEAMKSVDSVADLLPLYLQSLRAPQEAWLQEQLFVRRLAVLGILAGGERVGYSASDVEKGLLLQLFLRPERLSLAEAAFDLLLAEAGLRHAFVTTRDPVALSLCLARMREARLEAFLFEHGGAPAPPEGRALRPATAGDASAIRALAGDFFPEVERQVSEGWLHLLEHAHGPIAVGYASDRHCTPGTANVGAFVAPEHRGRGVGTELFAGLARVCSSRGWAPIAACYHENLASRRALERAGFVCRDRTFLVDF